MQTTSPANRWSDNITAHSFIGIEVALKRRELPMYLTKTKLRLLFLHTTEANYSTHRSPCTILKKSGVRGKSGSKCLFGKDAADINL